MTQGSLLTALQQTEVTAVDRAVLIGLLTGKGWRTARALRQCWPVPDRQLRAIASASAGRIVSGQQGYALIEEVTVEEANHAAAWLDAQARQMSKRASEIRRAMHKRHAA